MDVLLLGGTGSIGKALVDVMMNGDYEIYVTSRLQRTSPASNIHYITGNAHNVSFLTDVLQRKYDAVVDFMIYTPEEFQERLNLLLNNTGQYLFLSSSTVYAKSEQPITEESPRLLDVCADQNLLNSDFYPIKKAKEEDILKNSGRNNWTIIRPYISYNDERLQLGVFEKEIWLWRALNGRSIPLPQDVAAKTTTMTYSKDVAKMIQLTIGNTKSCREVYHLTGNQHMTWKEILSIYCKVLESERGIKPEVYMPENYFGIAETIGNYNSFRYDRIYDRIFDNSKIKQLCGDSYQFTPVQDGLEQCLKRFLQTPRFKSVNVKLEAYLNRMVGEKTSLSEFSTGKQKVFYMGYYRFPGVMKNLARLHKIS